MPATTDYNEWASDAELTNAAAEWNAVLRVGQKGAV
jgi:hypothetical protein